MPITYNGTAIDNVKYNNTALDKVYYNGTLVWENYKWEYHTDEIQHSQKFSNGGSMTLTYTPSTPMKIIKMNFRYSMASSSSSDRTITITYYTKETPSGIKQTYSDSQHGSSWPTVTVASPANEQTLTRMTIHVKVGTGVSTSMNLRIREYYLWEKGS